MIKIDFEKAYDKFDRNFILTTLKFFNFSDSWINLIQSCISFVTHSIIINGEMSDSIFPHRGLMQGDIISPLLFILCMEILTKIINFEVEKGNWRPAKVKDVVISHFPFTNDILLFARVDDSTINAVDGALRVFLDCFRLNIIVINPLFGFLLILFNR